MADLYKIQLRELFVILASVIVSISNMARAEEALQKENADYMDQAPMWSPDGSKIAFMRSYTEDIHDIYIYDLKNGEERQLVVSNAYDGNPAWSPDGERIILCSDRNDDKGAYIINTDGSDLRKLSTDPDIFCDSTSWSTSGEKIAVVMSNNDDHSIYVMDANGTNAELIYDGASYDVMGRRAWSKDDGKILFGSSGDKPVDRSLSWPEAYDNFELFVLDLETNEMTQLTNNQWEDSYATWSPDWSMIAYTRFNYDENRYAVAVMNADGSDARIISEPKEQAWDGSWSPDGERVVYSSHFVGGKRGLVIVDINAGSKQRITNLE